MRRLPNSRLCTRCETTFRTDKCPKCQINFLRQQMMETQRDLPARFREQLSTQKTLLNELLDKVDRKECSKKDILSQIDHWESKIIERIHYKAELARQQLDCLIMKNNQTIIKDARALRKEMREKKKKNDFVENDIQRLKEDIVRVQSELKKLSSTNVELYTEPDHMIDWNHLIFVREKSNEMVSALVNERTTNDGRKGRIALNQHRKSSSSDNENDSKESVNSKINVSDRSTCLVIEFR